jgi:hypothetical protein
MLILVRVQQPISCAELLMDKGVAIKVESRRQLLPNGNALLFLIVSERMLKNAGDALGRQTNANSHVPATEIRIKPDSKHPIMAVCDEAHLAHESHV